jgi:hypothetical protein
MRTPVTSWTIESGESASDGILFGNEGIIGADAPAVTAGTTRLRLEYTRQSPVAYPDASATWRKLYLQGELAYFNVSSSAGQGDILKQLIPGGMRVRVVATDDSDVVQAQGSDVVVDPITVRT